MASGLSRVLGASSQLRKRKSSRAPFSKGIFLAGLKVPALCAERSLMSSSKWALAPHSSSQWQAHFGPLIPLLEDPSVTEIMVNGTNKVFIEQKGLLKKTSFSFESEAVLYQILHSIAEYVGRELSEQSPCLDARLPDGSRVNIVIPPVAVDGPSVTIRKFSPFSMNHEQLIQSGMFDEKIAYFLSCCVNARLNMLICGGTGSGKTTLLNVLSSFIPSHERVVSIEDSAELKIKNDNLVRLEARPATSTDPGVSIRNLVINALRMRPDRIIVGECRGSEAFDMLQAMNTGHEGSMTTIHANSSREALRRLETMVLMTGTDFPMRVIREHMSGAIDVIINVQRTPDGRRRVTEIIEVGNMESDVILTQGIFAYDPAKGGFHSLGFVPRFIHEFTKSGVDFPLDFFNNQYNVRALGGRKK
jgi:pilus assembly protein CpaF